MKYIAQLIILMVSLLYASKPEVFLFIQRDYTWVNPIKEISWGLLVRRDIVDSLAPL